MVSSISQAAVEALTATSYIETYLDTVDHLPNEIQKYLTQLREIDYSAKELMSELTKFEETFDGSVGLNQRKQLIGQLNRLLLKKKELGDQKLELLSIIFEIIDNKSRQLETDFNNLEQSFASTINLKEKQEEPIYFAHSHIKTPSSFSINSNSKVSSGGGGSSGGARVDEKVERRQKRRVNTSTRETSPFDDDIKKDDEDKLRRKKKRGPDKPPGDKIPIGFPPKIPGPIDPSEPVYCLCREISYGEMVGCDNEGCPIEWYHFNCVNLTHKPKGKWYCPKCRGDRPSLLSPELAEHGRRTRKTNIEF